MCKFSAKSEGCFLRFSPFFGGVIRNKPIVLIFTQDLVLIEIVKFVFMEEATKLTITMWKVSRELDAAQANATVSKTDRRTWVQIWSKNKYLKLWFSHIE